MAGTGPESAPWVAMGAPLVANPPLWGTDGHHGALMVVREALKNSTRKSTLDLKGLRLRLGLFGRRICRAETQQAVLLCTADFRSYGKSRGNSSRVTGTFKTKRDRFREALPKLG